MTPWPPQTRAVEQVLAAIAGGARRIALCLPTGGGKTWVMEELTRIWRADRLWVGLYTNRRWLVEQLDNDFTKSGIDHGIRAAGEDEELEKPVQIMSIQTERSRRKSGRALHPCQRVAVDEGHIQCNPTAKEILDEHLEAGAVYVMFTATPLGMAEMCDVLIVAGNVTDLRACGANVPAIHFAPDEPDMKAFRAMKKLDAAERKARKESPLFGQEEAEAIAEQIVTQAMAPARVYGSVYENFKKINPTRRPTLLFAPGVAESLWYAERFCGEGIPWAHIDGEEIWINGEFKTADGEQGKRNRRELLEASRDGRIVGISCRFVLREGINAPWLSHCVFATIFGSLQSYLQSGGRMLRSYPALDFVTIQDHGGNWWRYGSLNEDRQWELTYTSEIATAVRADRLRGSGKEPFRCPRCGRIWSGGRRCAPERGGCGMEFPRLRSRPVLTVEGILKERVGDIFKPRRVCKDPDAQARWERMYWRSKTVKGNRTFAAAMALFAQENYWQWPDESWPLMPTNFVDKYRLVKEVAMESLTSVPARARPKGFNYGEGETADVQ